eukprot:3068888-Prymnesium_polylepis.2
MCNGHARRTGQHGPVMPLRCFQTVGLADARLYEQRVTHQALAVPPRAAKRSMCAAAGLCGSEH